MGKASREKRKRRHVDVDAQRANADLRQRLFYLSHALLEFGRAAQRGEVPSREDADLAVERASAVIDALTGKTQEDQ